MNTLLAAQEHQRTRRRGPTPQPTASQWALLASLLLGGLLAYNTVFQYAQQRTLQQVLVQYQGRSSSFRASQLTQGLGGDEIGADAGRAAAADAALQQLELQVWSRGPKHQGQLGNVGSRPPASGLEALLAGDEQQALRELCGRVLYHTLNTSVRIHGAGAHHAFVATGDIPDQWIRDSSVQLGVYLPRIEAHPSLRQVTEGGIRRQAAYILADPWANSFRETFVQPEVLPLKDRQQGRGGWVATRNYEPDSGAYFISLLWNYYRTPGLYAPERLLNETVVHDAVAATIRTWRIEQRHEERSPYRYEELGRDGLGPKCAYTGMVWGAFRPSDDMQTLPFNIPVNMYIAAALERALALNALIWRSPHIDGPARQLLADIRAGIERFGVVPVDGDPAQKMYAYEVDGLGNAVHDFDDPNLPSLLSIPLLGYRHYDELVYQATRRRLLSAANPYYYKSDDTGLAGLGSPHTLQDFVWPLALMVQALTSSDTSEQAQVLRWLSRMHGGSGLMHESVWMEDWNTFTRDDFGWANSMLLATVEALLPGVDCDAEAQALHLRAIREREGLVANATEAAGGSSSGGPAGDRAVFFERLEQTINTVSSSGAAQLQSPEPGATRGGLQPPP